MAAPAPARTPVRSAAADPRRRPGAPAPRRAAPAARPPLRLVDDARLKAAHRRRRTRLVVVVAALFATGCLFALAAFNALLVSGQGRLDQLELQVAEAQTQYSTNRLRVAQLESPDRIVEVAQERLGMVPPPELTYLTPSQEMAAQAGARGSERSVDEGAETGASWAAAKPYLRSRP